MPTLATSSTAASVGAAASGAAVRAGHTSARRRHELWGLSAWVAVVAVSIVWGRASIIDQGLGINAAPLTGRWHWEPDPRLVLPAAVGGIVAIGGPGLARRLRWSLVPAMVGAGAIAWTVSLAVTNGWDALTQPLTTRHEYEPYAARIDDVDTYFRDFIQRLPDAPVHVQGHPPGAPLVPRALDAVGLGGAGWLALLVIAGWGVAVAAAVVAARSVAGEDLARRAAPALVLLPAALWAGTSMDALFAGVLCAGVALAVHRGTTLRGERCAAALGGGVLGVGLMLTYGGAALVALPVGVQLLRRRPVHALLVAAGVAAVLLATWLATGFWWFDGLDATRAAYHAGVASQRPAPYFALAGNPGALALALGPAVAVGLASAVHALRSRVSWLPLSGAAVVAMANASLLSKGEVERIWLLFVPWVAVAAPGNRRTWLVAQATLAILLEAWVRTKW